MKKDDQTKNLAWYKTGVRARSNALILTLLISIIPMSYNACSSQFNTEHFVQSGTTELSSLDLSTNSNKLDGSSIYHHKCSVCHLPLENSTKRFASYSRIQNALNNNATMSILKGRITKGEVEAIAVALQGGRSIPPEDIEQYACVPSRGPGHSDLRRLTKYEINNTLEDLFGSAAMAKIKPAVLLLTRDLLVDDFDSIDQGVTRQHVNSMVDFAEQLSSTVIQDTSISTAVIGTCSQSKVVDPGCVNKFITEFGAKVFRRPLSSSEVSKLTTLYNESAAITSDAKDGYYALLFYLFQSIDFIYKIEIGTQSNLADATIYDLTPYELATRMSYLIWGTMPDEILMGKAKGGTLTTQTGYDVEIDRLLAHPKAKVHFRHFYQQWLKTKAQENVAFSANFLEGINPNNLKSEMAAELQEFVDHTVWNQKGNYQTLMTSDHIFPRTPVMASIYQVAQWDGNPNNIVRASPGTRTGLLGRAALLDVSVDQGRPIKRGVFILKKILCGILPQPMLSELPIGATDPAPPLGTVTSRHIYTEKTKEASCVGCHAMINPLGFAFSNYDSLGRYQTREKIFDPNGLFLGAVDVDSKIKIALNSSTKTDVSGAVELSELIGDSRMGSMCFVDQWYQYSSGRLESDDDGCSKQSIYNALTKNNGNIVNMIRATAMTPTFKTLRKKD
jgi:hypothetical protein